MKFMKFGNKIINLELVTRVEFMDISDTGDTLCIGFYFDKDNYLPIPFTDKSSLITAQNNLINNLGVIAK